MREADLGSLSDADLVAAIADGDRLALRTLYVRHQPWLTARLRHRCGDSDVVADAVQEALLRCSPMQQCLTVYRGPSTSVEETKNEIDALSERIGFVPHLIPMAFGPVPLVDPTRLVAFYNANGPHRAAPYSAELSTIRRW